MKNLVAIVALFLSMSVIGFSQNEDIVKRGINLGPLPVIAFDADKGFQYGALLNIYNYGDGSLYPNYASKFYIEASFFTKGSQYYSISYDNKNLISGVRWSSTVSTSIDKAMDFYGFNGYSSWFNQERFAAGKKNKKSYQDPDKFLYSPFYRYARLSVSAKTDFIGDISNNLKWEAGYHFSYMKIAAVDRNSINKGKPEYNKYPSTMSTLYEDYIDWGLIDKEEADGGIVSSIRLGLVYDSRNKEGAPSRGIWAEGHITAAPKLLGTEIPYYRYSITMRQYLPLVANDILTLAYRVNYEGTFGNSAPFYALPYITVMGEGSDKDGMGGYRTVRGMMRDRVLGLDMATYTAEIRWRFANFNYANQNIALCLSGFSDGSMVTRGRSLTFNGESELYRMAYNNYIAKGREKDTFHSTVGAGFRFIMNENFIVAFEYGTPITHLLPKSHKLYNQDGTGAFYINTGFLF